MISFVFRFTFATEDRAEVAEILHLLGAESRREPGCVTYIPHQVQDDPDTILIYEQYRDEGSLEAHRESAHYKKYAIEGLFQKMRDRNIEHLTALL